MTTLQQKIRLKRPRIANITIDSEKDNLLKELHYIILYHYINITLYHIIWSELSLISAGKARSAALKITHVNL